MNPRSRTSVLVAWLVAALGLGAGVGAIAYATLSDDASTIVRQVTVSSSEPAVTGRALAIGDIYDRSERAVVEITAASTQFSGSQSAQGSGFVFDDERSHHHESACRRRGELDLGPLLGRVEPWRDARRNRSLDRPGRDQGGRSRVVPRASPARRLERGRRGRRGRGDGKPVRPRGDRDERHRQRAPSSDDGSEQLHDQRHDPDRCRDQPRKLGRAAARSGGPRDRRQCPDRKRVGRLRRRRVRDSLRHRAIDRLAAGRVRRGRARLSRNLDAASSGGRGRHRGA